MKKEWILPFACILLPILLALPSSCTSDSLPEPTNDFCDSLNLANLTYDVELRPIIETSCMESSCHGAGSPDGDYTSYQGILPDLENGKVNNRVLVERTMPQAGSPPLTDLELDMFQCWLGDNHPEN